MSFINCIGLFYGVDNYETRLKGLDILLKGLYPILREKEVILLSLMLFIGLRICCYAYLGVYNLVYMMFLAGRSPFNALSFGLVTFLLNLPVFPIHSYSLADLMVQFIFLQLSFIFLLFLFTLHDYKNSQRVGLLWLSTQQNQRLFNLIKFLSMSFFKVGHNTGALNHASTDSKGQKRGNSTQKIYNSGSKVSLGQKLLIQKFIKQTEELKQIKKTITTLSNSRLAKMHRLKAQQLLESESMNLQKLSQPSNRQKMFKINRNPKFSQNFNINKNSSSPKKQEDPYLEPNTHEQLNSEQRLEEIAIKERNSVKQDLLKDEEFDYMENGHKKQTQFFNHNLVNQEKQSLPLNSTNKQRAFSAGNLKSMQTLARIYKNQKLHDNQSSQISQGSSNPMELKHRYQQRLKESRAKIMSSKIKIVESQTNFKLQKKIKQNIQLIEKQTTLHQLIHARMERQREKAQKMRRRNEQKRLVHQSRKMKVGIQRAFKKEFQAKEKQFHRTSSEQTLLNVTYNRFAKEMDEIKKQQLLAYKLEFLKNLESVQLRPLIKANNPEFDSQSLQFQQ